VVNRLSAVNSSLPPRELQKLLLMQEFLKAVIAGIREDMKKQLRATWRKRFKEAFTGTFAEIFAELDEFLEDIGEGKFTDVQAIREIEIGLQDASESHSDATGSASLSLSAHPSVNVGATGAEGTSETAQSSINYSTVLLRTIDVKSLLTSLRDILAPLGIRHLYIFIDDFSELPSFAMRVVVDVLLAPLNNWSNELVKFKVAACPGRIYYGEIDKSKIDEISLDTYRGLCKTLLEEVKPDCGAER
jgi:hypothetical protein